MPNIEQIISGHNKSIQAKFDASSVDSPRPCNCRNACPLDGNCLAPSVIYQASVTRDDTQTKESYIGLTEGPFKTRFYCHTPGAIVNLLRMKNNVTPPRSANIYDL